MIALRLLWCIRWHRGAQADTHPAWIRPGFSLFWFIAPVTRLLVQLGRALSGFLFKQAVSDLSVIASSLSLHSRNAAERVSFSFGGFAPRGVVRTSPCRYRRFVKLASSGGIHQKCHHSNVRVDMGQYRKRVHKLHRTCGLWFRPRYGIYDGNVITTPSLSSSS